MKNQNLLIKHQFLQNQSQNEIAVCMDVNIVFHMYDDRQTNAAVPDRKLSNKIYVPHNEKVIRQRAKQSIYRDKSFILFFYFILSIYSLNWFFPCFLISWLKTIFDRYIFLAPIFFHAQKKMTKRKNSKRMWCVSGKFEEKTEFIETRLAT